MILDPASRILDLTQAWCTGLGILSDAQSVITMRLMGLGGAWDIPDGEHNLMFQEKIPAFTEGLVAGTKSALAYATPEQVMQAMINPISDSARNNRTRLAKLGPKAQAASQTSMP